MIRPLVLQLWPGAAFWAVYVVQMAAESWLMMRLRPTRAGMSQDRGSMVLILAAFWGAMVAATAVAVAIPVGTLWSHRRAWFWSGVVAYAAGGALRQVCFRILGRHFTPAVTVTTDQPVIERGPYRWIRHPSYAGGVLMFLGYGLALTHAGSVAVMAAAAVIAYAYRIRVEERALAETLGDAYRAYMRRTKRLVPWIW
jgi:protein-S-isoprenylcysteine O-methyltransferase Ste14